VIDRDSRNALAEAIRALASGAISNFEFETRIPTRSLDPAIDAVFSGGAWFLYSDLSEYRLIGRHRLPRTAKSEIARWVLFLKTDLPYEWPTLTGLSRLLMTIFAFVTLGLSSHVYRRTFRRYGDFEVWPFARRSDFDGALAQPAYLKT